MRYDCEICNKVLFSWDCLVRHAQQHGESYCQKVKMQRHQQNLVDLTIGNNETEFDDNSAENADRSDDFNLVEFLLNDSYVYTGNDKDVIDLMNQNVSSITKSDF